MKHAEMVAAMLVVAVRRYSVDRQVISNHFIYSYPTRLIFLFLLRLPRTNTNIKKGDPGIKLITMLYNSTILNIRSQILYKKSIWRNKQQKAHQDLTVIESLCSLTHRQNKPKRLRA